MIKQLLQTAVSNSCYKQLFQTAADNIFVPVPLVSNRFSENW
jgi:hypothetical protein